MSWLLLLIGVVILAFGFVLAFGAPYLPTLNSQQETALDLLDLSPGQTLLELGSGDGRMLNAAAKRGVKAIGYELNPLLYVFSLVNTWRHRHLVSVRFANFWSVRLPECDGVYVFLLDKYMPKLYKKLTQEISSSVRLVSFAFQIPGVKHTTESNGLYLYKINNKSGANR